MVVEGVLQGLMLLEDLGFCEHEVGVMKQMWLRKIIPWLQRGSMRAEV